MSELLTKSISNKEAADLLISNRKYAPSVHCSYYSFIQTAIYVLDLYGLTSNRQVSSHEYIRNKLFKLLSEQYRLDSIRFQDDFNKIKKMRNRSDYLDLEITEPIAIEVKSTSIKLTNIVRKLENYGSTK